VEVDWASSVGVIAKTKNIAVPQTNRFMQIVSTKPVGFVRVDTWNG
jgi:hypothetical protein